MKKTSFKALFSENILILILVLLTLPFLLLSLYIHPSADDYIYSSWYKLPEGSHGYWSYQLWNYQSWNGRYFSTLLLTCNPLVFKSLAGYRLIPVFILLLLYKAIYFFVGALNMGMRKKTMHIVCLLVVITYFNLVPSLPETMYWMSGSVTYTLGISLFFFLSGLLLMYYHGFKNKGALRFFIVLFLCATSGFNELLAFQVLVLVLSIFLTRFAANKRPDYFALSLFVFAAVLFVVIALAPGNKGRLEQFENHYNLNYALSSMLRNTLKIAVYTFKNPPVLMLLTLILFNAPHLNFNSGIYKKFRRILKPTIIFITVGLVAVFYFISAYNMGIEPPLRVHGYIILLLLAGAFALMVTLNHKGEVFKLPVVILKKINVVLITLYIVFLCGSFSRKAGEPMYYTGNVAQAVSDLVHKAAAYDKELVSRYSIIKNTVSSEDCIVVPPLSEKPQSIYFTDIKADSSHWINWGTALYFNTGCIKTSPDI
ncbi:MAG: hypothetical protein BWY70_00059 [Bacteroidetes bacterium ADurb.Bin408]|nr:MAG: hypothetical protein BWY70_00059 [Bacteroidetes bacterium ADurb.Bin408]